MFPIGDRLFFDADHRRGMPLRHLLHSLLLSEPWRVSVLHCSVPLFEHDSVECNPITWQHLCHVAHVYVHLLLPICCKMFYFSIVGFYTSKRVFNRHRYDPVRVVEISSFFFRPSLYLKHHAFDIKKTGWSNKGHSTSSWAARGTLHCRENSRAKAHSAKENEARRRDIPRRCSTSKKSRSPKGNMCHSKR